MADLTGIQASQSVKLTGNDLSGVETYPVQSTDAGSLHTNLRDILGAPVGTEDNPIYTSGAAELLSPLPSAKVTIRKVLNPSSVEYSTFTIVSKTAIKEFHIGGRVACEGTLAKYFPTNQEYVPGGQFNSSGNVALWTNTGIGDSAIGSWAYTTAQFIEGTGSATYTFTKSDINNYPEITYTWGSAQDFSSWRYLRASARVTVAAGGARSRTISIRLTSGTAVRIYSITGTTTTAPFSTEQWLNIIGEIENPTSTAGTGTFDINAVNSVSLRLQDGGNKTGTIYWDDVRFVSQSTILEKIYTASGTTNQLQFDPIITYEVGDVVLMSVRNNSATAGEIQASTSGVDIA